MQPVTPDRPESPGKLPVLLLVYNRPSLTAKVISAIESYNPDNLYVSADGPRTHDDTDSELVNEVRKLVSEIDISGSVQVLAHDRNLGPYAGVIAGLDWFFSKEPEGVILEDDCLPTADFFRFSEAILSRYRDQHGVFGVSGSNPGNIGFSNGADYGFMRVAPIWGWGSWSDRWAKYDRHLLGFRREIANRGPEWPSKGLKFALEWHLKKILEKGPSTWDYQLSWTVVREGGLWVVPNSSLVTNLGFGPDATHTKSRKRERASVPPSLAFPLRHPEITAIEPKQEEKFLHRNLRVYHPLFVNYIRDWIRNFRYGFFSR